MSLSSSSRLLTNVVFRGNTSGIGGGGGLATVGGSPVVTNATFYNNFAAYSGDRNFSASTSATLCQSVTRS